MGNGIEMRTARGVIVSMVCTSSVAGRAGPFGEYVTALAIASRLDRDKSLSQKGLTEAVGPVTTRRQMLRGGEKSDDLLGSFEVLDVS